MSNLKKAVGAGLVLVASVAGASPPPDAKLLRIRVAKPSRTTYRLSVHCDILLSEAMTQSPDPKAKPRERSGSFDIVGEMLRVVSPAAERRFLVKDKFLSLSVKATGILKDQIESIRAQGKARNKAVYVDQRGKVTGAAKEKDIEFNPLYMPFALSGVAVGSKWSDVRLSDGEQVTVEYDLTRVESTKEWQVGQKFKGTSVVSGSDSYTIFDPKTGLPIRGRLSYIQRDRGALTRISYELTTVPGRK